MPTTFVRCLISLLKRPSEWVKQIRFQCSIGSFYPPALNSTASALTHKPRIVQDFIGRIHPENVCDLGANVGDFSRLASDAQIPTFAFYSAPSWP